MEEKRIAGERATEYIEDGMTIGLGTGSTAYFMIKKVGEMVKEGMKLRAVATSKRTEELAKELHIPVVDINEVDRIDLAIDGVDEIDKQFNAIKGGGGALFREKIVASLADEVIWIMDESKLVEHIGAFPLPIEVLPYGYMQVMRQLKEESFSPIVRRKDNKIFVTDNGNYIVDLHIGNSMDVGDVHHKLNRMTGVLETGLFLNMCKRIIVGTEFGVKIIENDFVSTLL